MCLLLAYCNPHPNKGSYKLIVTSIRDESYHRPTKLAHFWETSPNILAGMDMQQGREGGTWFGISKLSGRIGVLINVLQSKESYTCNLGKKGRGYLVPDYLQEGKTGEEYLEDIAKLGAVYNQFSLVTFDLKGNKYSVCHYDNVHGKIQKLPDGIHGFGSCLPEKPFIKVIKGKRTFADIVDKFGFKDKEDALLVELDQMMSNRERNYPDPEIMELGQGFGDEMLRRLSSIMVDNPSMNYGSRTKTVVLVDYENEVTFVENTMEEPVDQLSPKRYLFLSSIQERGF